jgi:HAMP domain-containing protein
MRISMDSGVTRIALEDESRIPRWLRAILEVPLEVKLLGANLIIVSVAVLLLFGPVQLQPTRLTDAYIVVAALILGATVNSWLVRLALGPLKSIERVAKWVSQGRNDKRVPASMVADHELRRLSIILNDMLDNLMADRVRMETLSAEVAYAERSQVVQELRDSLGQKLADASRQITAVANEVVSHAHASRLAEISALLRSATKDVRNISHTVGAQTRGKRRCGSDAELTLQVQSLD